MAKKGMRRKVARRGFPRGRSLGRSSGIVGTLSAELGQLQRQRDHLDQQISALSNALRALGAPLHRGPGRPPGSTKRGTYRTGSLKEYIHNILSGNGVMAVKDITDAVTKAGYPTRNQTLAKSVGIALAQMTTVEKVGRGKFKIR